jgi:hypothetical protein
MPKRHNLFQDLIASIHQQLPHPGRVEESAMLLDSACNQKREVDIVIRSRVAGYDFVVSVECTDLARLATVEWIERMCSKHSTLPTDKLVLVSKSGFTEAAESKAKAFGAETLSLEVAEKVDWTKHVDHHAKLFLAAIDSLTVVKALSPTYKPASRFEGVSMQTLFLDPDGRPRATADEIAHAVLYNKEIISALYKNTVEKDVGGEVMLPTKPGVKMRLPDASEHDVQAIKVVVLLKNLRVGFNLSRHGFQHSQLAYGTATNPQGEFLMTLVETKDSPPKAQVRIRRPWGELQTYNLTEPASDVPKASPEAMRALIGQADSDNLASLWDF